MYLAILILINGMKKILFIVLSALFLAFFSSSCDTASSEEKSDVISSSLDHISGNSSATDKYRVVWCTDPSTETIIGWNQREGKPGMVHYGKVDQKRHHEKYEKSQATSRVDEFLEMKSCFVRLKDLEPDTEYFFVIKDTKGVSRRLNFKTASSKNDSFTFVAGGDTRNGRAVRQSGNLLVSKLKPLFVALTGDMVWKDEAKYWTALFDDWQETIDSEGRVTPIVPHRGNKDAYYALSIGEDLFRYYVLNSMLPADGKQGEWLVTDLEKNHKKYTHLVAGYHHPMRPHTKKKKEGKNPYKWAKTFYKYGIDLSCESDSHLLKRTFPLKPYRKGDEGFVKAENDKNATVFSGEGSWGAPHRPADDSKSWTRDATKGSGFDWIYVSEEKMELKTVLIKDSVKVAEVSKPGSYVNPENLILWQAKGGAVVSIPADR